MAKIDLTIQGKDKASGAVKGVTGSIVLANLATQALTAGMKKLIKIGKDAINNWAIQEKAENDLRNATGMNIDEFKKYASEMQNVTTVGDEVILGTLKLASTMGVSNDRLTEAADKALSLSKAMDVDMKTAMKLVAAEMGGNVSMMTRYIPALKGVKDETEQAAIVNEVYAKGMKIAKGEAETFGGKLKQLENKMGDASEEFGRLVSILGEPITGGLLDALDPKSITNFVVAAINGYVKFFEAQQKYIVKPLDEWATFYGFELPAALMGMWDKTKVIFQAVKDGILAIFNDNKIVDVVQETFDTMGAISLHYQRQILAIETTLRNERMNNFDAVVAGAEKMINKVLGIEKKGNEDSKKEAQRHRHATKEITRKGLEVQELTWKDYASNVMSIVNSLAETMQMAFNTVHENNLNTLQESLDAQLEAIDENALTKLENEGVAEETRSEQAQSKIASIQSELAAETDLNKKAKLQKDLIEAQSEAKRIKILDAAEKKKEAVRKKAADKEKAEKIKQFKANQALAIANVWINAASAIMGYMAAFAGMGIPGIVLMGVMSGVALVMAGIQTGMIASQTPSFETGGVIGGTSLSGDRVQINANSKERVLTAEQNKGFEEMIFGSGGFKGESFYIENMTVVADDPETFRNQTIEQARFEAAR